MTSRIKKRGGGVQEFGQKLNQKTSKRKLIEEKAAGKRMKQHQNERWGWINMVSKRTNGLMMNGGSSRKS